MFWGKKAPFFNGLMILPETGKPEGTREPNLGEAKKENT